MRAACLKKSVHLIRMNHRPPFTYTERGGMVHTGSIEVGKNNMIWVMLLSEIGTDIQIKPGVRFSRTWFTGLDIYSDKS